MIFSINMNKTTY